MSKKVARRRVATSSEDVVKKATKVIDSYEIDTGNGAVVGLKLRTRNESQSWVLQTRDNNQKIKRVKIGLYPEMDRSTARKIAKDLKYEIQNGKSLKKKKSKTINELVDIYIKDKLVGGELKETTAEDYRKVVDRHCKKLLPMPIDDKKLTIDFVHSWYRDGSGVKAKKDYAFRVINACFTFAEHQQWIERNVFAIWAKNKNNRYKKNVRDTFILQEELQIFLHGILNSRSTTGRDACMLMLTTGMRLNECRLLQWSEVDFDKKVINLGKERVKNKTDFEVVLNSLALAILKTRYKNKISDYVFPQSNNPEKPIDNVRKILKNSGDISPHDLRRTFATYLRLNPVGEKIISQLLNHKSGLITHDYMITGREELREASQMLSNFINQQVEVVLKETLIDDYLSTKESLNKEHIDTVKLTNKRGGYKEQLDDRWDKKELTDTVVVKANNGIELTIYPEKKETINLLELEVIGAYRFYAEEGLPAFVKNKKRMVHERKLDARISSNRNYYAEKFNKLLQKNKNRENARYGRDVGYGVIEKNEGKGYDLAIMIESKDGFNSERCTNFSKEFYSTRDTRFIEVF